MSYLLDTSVAIELRDLNGDMLDKLAGLNETVQISIITQIELLNGLHGNNRLKALRAERIAKLFEWLTIVNFDADCAIAYESIVETTSFSRRKILDRMIASQALTADATLVTRNAEDFSDIPGLKLLAW